MSGGTHTYALLDVSPATFQEIYDRLKAAGYEHAFMDGDTVIDMHGIGLRASEARERSEDRSAPSVTSLVLLERIRSAVAVPGAFSPTLDELPDVVSAIARQRDAARAEAVRLDALINNPHTADFLESVKLEAAHQRERWAAEGDAGKSDADWFWLIGYLAGKALNKPEKQLHHIITTAAACLNWHAHRTGTSTAMRPGTDRVE